MEVFRNIGNYFRRLNIIWKILIPIFLITIIFVSWKVISGNASAKNPNSINQRTATVQRGTLTVNISGSGTVRPVLRNKIQTQVSGTVIESFIFEGKEVKTGEALLTLDSSNADIALKKQENALKQKEFSYNSQLEQLESLVIRAPFSGRISNLKILDGDNINNGNELLTIVDDTRLKTLVSFENSYISQFNNISEVLLHIPDYLSSLTAKIETVYKNGTGVDAIAVVENPGALIPGLKVYVEISTASGTLFNSSPGILDWYCKKTLRSEVSGTAEVVSVYDNQSVQKGSILIEITNDELPVSIEKSMLELEDAKASLELAYDELEKYTVTAPFDGILVSVTELSPGDILKNGAVLAEIVDTGEMLFDIDVDELDITGIKPGQTTSITVEALEDTLTSPMFGEVSSIAVEGKTNNGVTSFPVTISVPGRKDFKIGMNVDASIQIINKENTLLVPLEALQKQSGDYFVWVKREGVSELPWNNQDNDLPQDNSTKKGSGLRGGLQNISPEDREALKNMTPEERQEKIKELTPEKDSNDSQSSEALTQNRTGSMLSRLAQSNTYYEGAIPVRVTIGGHNETYAEIIDGLIEGEIVVLPEQILSDENDTQQAPDKGFLPGGGMGGMGSFNRTEGAVKQK